MSPTQDDLDDEIRGHLAISIKDRIERGEDPASARLAALKEFGNVTLTRGGSDGPGGSSAPLIGRIRCESPAAGRDGPPQTPRPRRGRLRLLGRLRRWRPVRLRPQRRLRSPQQGPNRTRPAMTTHPSLALYQLSFAGLVGVPSCASPPHAHAVWREPRYQR